MKANLKSTPGFIGGIVVKQIDVTAKTLQYTLLVAKDEFDFDKLKKSVWSIHEPHKIKPDMSANNTIITPNMIPENNYWERGWLVMQKGLETAFVELSGTAATRTWVSRLPSPSYLVSPDFGSMLPYVIAFLLTPTVIHTTSNLSTEMEIGVQKFLSVMGLPRSIFYASHFVTAYVKSLPCIIASALLIVHYKINVSVSLWFIAFFLYSIGAVLLALMFAMFFNRSKTAMMLCVITWFGLCFVSMVAPPRTRVLFCHLASLNINQAFVYAVKAIDSHMFDEMGLMGSFDGGSTSFSLGSAILMLAVDVVWMFGLLLLMDYIKRSENIFRRFHKNADHNEEKKVGNGSAVTVTDESKTKDANEQPADIQISGLFKSWTRGEYAVNGVDLKVFRGGIAVLLGHNGAGKSTVFSMISGETKPTDGTITICGHDIRTNLEECQKSIGYCPQGNPLFEKLTVWEHLKYETIFLLFNLFYHFRFFYELKCGDNDARDNECESIMTKVNLMDKKNTISSKLSGGMKRKLCMGMALVGGSEVILLDEPTAGMDPSARRDVEKILADEKNNRTVLLTTHYMDEAETLGDRVAIMANGKLQAYGTMDFLKNKFGSGYALNVVVNDEMGMRESQEKILAIVNAYTGNAILEDQNAHGKQFEIMIPQQHIEKFPELLKHLEDNSESLNMSSFGLSLNSLEQIFMKVNNASCPVPLSRDTVKSFEPADKQTGSSLYLSQLYAMCLKRFYYSRRNIPQMIMQIVIPIAVMLVAGYMFSAVMGSTHDDPRSISAMGDVRIPVQLSIDDSKTLTTLNALRNDHVQVEYVDKSQNFSLVMQGMRKNLPAIPFAYQGTSQGYIAYFNPNALHSLPIVVNFLSNVQLGSGSISMSIEQYSKITTPMTFSIGGVDHDNADMMSEKMIRSIITTVSLSITTSSFSIFLVEEKTSQYRHQQLLTGASPFILWTVSMLFDFSLFLAAALCFAAIHMLVHWLDGYVAHIFFIWVLYVLEVIPLIYATSSLFKSTVKAAMMLIVLQFALNMVADMSSFIVSMVLVTFTRDFGVMQNATKIVQMICLVLIPTYPISYSATSISTYSVAPIGGVWDWENLGTPVMIMSIMIVALNAVFVLLQYKKIRLMLIKMTAIRKKNADRSEAEKKEVEKDADVCNERTRVETQSQTVDWETGAAGAKGVTAQTAQSNAPLIEITAQAPDSKDVLTVNHLVKRYDGGKLTAVDDVMFGVKSKECFGLLGTNGAGKTSTFNVLTGEQFATEGEVTINGVDVNDQVTIGYCPQFDALMSDLTGWENLVVLARAHGFTNPSTHVENVLKHVGMEKHAHKAVNKCSGGQRRRLSVAAAILSQANLMILDEPTAGVDPMARRDIWDSLSSMRSSGTALLLTSHSMAECEALCGRIAILKKGRMIAIGSAQHLKSRFGKNYSLSVSVPLGMPDWNKKKAEIISEVSKEFGAENVSLLTSSFNSIRWKISRCVSERWSAMFSRVLDIRRRVGVEDFCLTQTSLEDTFMFLAGVKEEAAEKEKEKEEREKGKEKKWRFKLC